MTLVLSKHGFITQGPQISEAQQQALQKHRDALHGVLDKMNEQIAKVKADPGLNAVGQKQRIDKVRQSARQELDEVSRTHGRFFRDGVEQAKKAIPTEVSYPKRPVPIGGLITEEEKTHHALREMMSGLTRQAREAEIRSHLTRMEEPDRAAAVMGAAEDQDLDTLMAVKNSPRFLRLVDGKVLNDASARYLRKRFASEYGQLSSAEAAYDLWHGNMMSAAKQVGRENEPITIPQAQ